MPHRRRPKDSFTMAMPKKAKITSAVLLLAVAAGCVIYLNRPESSASTQSTDDAYVQAYFTLAAPQVSGVIGKDMDEENQPAKKAKEWRDGKEQGSTSSNGWEQ